MHKKLSLSLSLLTVLGLYGCADSSVDDVECHLGERECVGNMMFYCSNGEYLPQICPNGCDALTGACIDAGVESGAKVVKKAAPDEKVGVMCLEDGRPSIVEYYDLSKEMMDEKDAAGDPAYNFGVILNYLFRVDALNRIAKTPLTLHVVEKKIKHIDDAGKPVKPDAPNGCKFEQLVLDMIHEMESCLPFEVEREKEFAPIKNATGVDSVESARALCEKNGITL